MSKSNILIVFISVLILIGSISWVKTTVTKIAFVRTGVVVDGYLGMKESKALHDKKIEVWQANIDSLSQQLNSEIEAFESSREVLKLGESKQRQELIRRYQINLESYKTAINQKAQQEYDKTVQGPINQINSFIEDYAKQEGYDIVLGTTQSGNILYGNEAVDITKDVLKALNMNYKKND